MKEPGKRKEAFLKEEFTFPTRSVCGAFYMRLFNLALAAFFITMAAAREEGAVVTAPVWTGLGLWALTIGAFIAAVKARLVRTESALEKMHLGYYVLALVLFAFLLRSGGLVSWTAAGLFAAEIALAGILIKWPLNMTVPALLLLAFGVFWIAGRAGLMPGREGLTLILVVFSAAAAEAGLLSRMKEEKDRRVLLSRDTLEDKNRQLERIMKTLKGRLDETEGVKEAAIRYAEEKDQELAEIKRDLEKHIEQLRATQRSMAFMIEDLNEMSGQLKEARDTLERRVSERTEELMLISRKLHRSEKLAFLGTLSGSITHELRNPLGVIKNALYALEMPKKTGRKKDGTRYIEVMKKEIDVIQRIIEDVLGFARTAPARFQRVNVNDVLNASIARLDIPELIDVRKELTEVPEVEADPTQLQHAVMNIASNAIIAMKGNGNMTFRSFVDRKKVCVEIEDNGPGIMPDQKKDIFEPLYTSSEKGTGLGLPLAKMMVENNKGKLTFTSVAGLGTKFRISLPVAEK